ncbi:Granzyme M [Phytophthora cinnamomi]|uniref:Granzyme M n=1 Tax=Phytophthora cinnamomi TaxID=4785 RepID=UPI0035595E82|nr:Granzyme M [Phytophthora cinnamomi]
MDRAIPQNVGAQITDMHRLVLVRVSGVVFFSDLVQKKNAPSTVVRGVTSDTEERRKPHRRTSSIAVDESSKCSGHAFCHCIDVISAASMIRFRSSRKHTELRQITRKSISLSENESAFLERFGAEAEATLRTIDISDLTATSSWARRGKTGGGESPAVMKLLERRIFMLQNTLWNPKSDAFDPKALEFEDAQWLPHDDGGCPTIIGVVQIQVSRK